MSAPEPASEPEVLHHTETTTPLPTERTATPLLDAAGADEGVDALEGALEEEGEGVAADPELEGEGEGEAEGDGGAGGGEGGGGGDAPEEGGDSEADAVGLGEDEEAAETEPAQEEAAGASDGAGAPVALPGDPGSAGGPAPGGPGGAVAGASAYVGAARPVPGVDIDLVAPAADFAPPQAEGVLRATGMAPGQHRERAQEALSGLQGQIEGLQAAIVARAEQLSAEVSQALCGLHPEIEAGLAGAAGAVDVRYESAKQAVLTAAGTAHGAVDTARGAAHQRLDQARSTHLATLAQTCASAQEQVSALRGTWTQPFTALEQTHTERFGQAARTAASQVVSQKETIAQTFAGSGTWVAAAVGERRVRAARDLVDRGAQQIRDGGATRARRAIDGLGHARIVESFLQPLVARVATFRTQAETAVGGAVDRGKGQIDTGATDAHARIDADVAAANSAFDEDRAAADSEFELAGEQLETDLRCHTDSLDGQFQDAAAGQVDGYRQFALNLSATLDGLPFLTADRAREIVADESQALVAMHQRNLADLDGVAARTRSTVETDVRLGIANLSTLQAQNQAEVDALRDRKVAAVGEAATRFGGSLDAVAQSVDVEVQRWRDPMAGHAAAYVQSITAELEVRRAASDAALSTALTTYQGELNAQVAGFAGNIRPQAAGEAVIPLLRHICSESYAAMRGMGTDENRLYNALRQCDSATMGHAAREMWGRMYPSSESLDQWIIDDCDRSEQAICWAYLRGDTAAGARLELNGCMNWYGDDEAQIERILRGLSPAQREQMQAAPEWAATNARLQRNLDGTDLNVTNALLAGNDARADAYRIRDTIDSARRQGDHDALHTALAGMDPARRAQIAQEFHHIRQQGFEAGARNVQPIDQAAAYDEFVRYTTRDVTVTHHHEHGSFEQTLSITGANRDLAEALIREGNDSVEADVARFEVERTRRGGPNQQNLETALTTSAEEQEAMRDPANAAAARQRQAERRAQFEARWQGRYGNREGIPANVSDAIGAMHARSGNADLEAETNRALFEDGTNSARVVALATQLAIDGAGTDEERLQRMWSRLTPQEADEAQRLWALRFGNGQTLENRLFGGFFSELSGDDAFDQRRRMLGDQRYFTGQYADRNLRLAEIEVESTDSLLGGLVSGQEGENLAAHQRALRELVDAVAARNGGTAFGPQGFLGTPQEYERYRELCAFVGVNAQHYRERTDAIANAVTTGLAIVGAVAAIILSGGTATPLVAAAVAAGVGAAGMAANYALRGGRYGWEQAAVDLGVTAVSAATAGAGAYLNGMNSGAGAFNAATRLGQSASRATVAFGTGMVNSSASTAMQDQTWRQGGLHGAGEVLYSGLRGGTAAAAGSAAMDSVRFSSWGNRFVERGAMQPNAAGRPTFTQAANGGNANWLTRAPVTALGGFGQGVAARSTELSFDAATGRYNGEFVDALRSIGLEGLRQSGQSFLEGVAEARQARIRQQQPAAPTPPPVPTADPSTQAPRTPATPGEAEVVARTAASPEVQAAVARVDAAEASTQTRLATSDQQNAAAVNQVAARADAGLTTSPDGQPVTTSITRPQAQAALDGVEASVRRTDTAVVNEAQAAHTDAARVIETVETRNRTAVLAEADPAATVARPTTPAAAPDAAAADPAVIGGRALGLNDAQIAQVRALDAEQMRILQDHLAAHPADVDGAIAAAAARRVAPAATPPVAPAPDAVAPPVRAWDDPTLTPSQAWRIYRAEAPNGTLTWNEFQHKFAQGLRFNPSNDRWMRPRHAPEPTWTPDGAAAQAGARNRRGPLTPEQETVLQLRHEARTEADFEALRQLEAQVDLPVPLRTPHDAYEQSVLRGLQTDADASGRPADVEAARQLAAEHALRPRLHEQAVEDLTAEVQRGVDARDRATTAAVLDEHAATGQPAYRPSVIVGMGPSGTGAAHADPRAATGDVIGVQQVAPPRPRRPSSGAPGDFGEAPPPSGDLASNLGHYRFGQTADEIRLGGGRDATQPSDVAEHPTSNFVRASELALASAMNRDASGIGTVNNEGSLPAARMRVEGEGDAAVIRTTLTVTSGGRTGEIDTHDLFLNSGLGPPRTLRTEDAGSEVARQRQITPEHQDHLQGRGQLLSGEQAVGMRPQDFAGQDVLAIGGGATAPWVGQAARTGGANSVELAGSMPRPNARNHPQLAAELNDVELRIRDRLDAGERVETSDALRNLQARHHEIVGRYVRVQEAELAALEARLADPAVADRAHLQERHDAIRRELDPFLGGRVNRNEATLADPGVRQVQMDVTRVVPRSDGRVDVFYADGTVRVVDRVVTCIGQRRDGEGTVDNLLANLPPGVRFRPVVEGGRVVGLESDPPGIRLAGAAAVGVNGVPPPNVWARMSPEDRVAYVEGVRAHANRPEAGANSRGIVPAFANVAENGAAMQTTQRREALLERVAQLRRAGEISAEDEAQVLAVRHDPGLMGYVLEDLEARNRARADRARR